MYTAIQKQRVSSEETLPLPGDRFLNDAESKEFDYEEKFRTPSKGFWQRLPRLALITHLTLISLYTLVTLILVNRFSSSGNHGPKLIYSPGSRAIEMERKMVHASFASKNPFKGPPSDELDHAWHTLFVNSNIRVSADELSKINRTSVPVTDAVGGYYAIPDVYHQLHCLKFLRQVIYSDYYHIEKPTTPIHIDHCIDNLRQNLMCKGDVSLLTFDWVPNDRAPKPNFEVEHECVNWEKLDDWAKHRRFDIFDEKTLVHPTLGPSFPEKEYKATGKVPGHPDFRPNYHNHDDDHISHRNESATSR